MSETKFYEALRAKGFKLVRQKKHRVHKNPEGKTLVTASTPSDWRWSRSALRQLVKLCGPIEADHRPLRARREHGKLGSFAESAQEAQELQQSVTPEPIPEAALSRADRLRLKRWEKHESQRKVKIERQRVVLGEVAQLANQAYMENADDWLAEVTPDEAYAAGIGYADGIVEYIKENLGFYNAAMVVADIVLSDGEKALGFYIRVNSWFVDFFEGVIRENPTWTESNGSVRVEVWSDFQVKDLDSFVGAKMYFGGWTPTATQPVVATPSPIGTQGEN
jgi:predicted RNA binding protein YcfA (HicA-like mRNA interferase family)